MTEFETALRVMDDLFTQDRIFAFATVDSENKPSVRLVDVFYDGDVFFVVTHNSTGKVKDIRTNPYISMVRDAHRFSGIAHNIGHPLEDQNKEIREKLIEVFEPWYFRHHDEKDEDTTILRIDIKTGFFYQDDIGYEVDFEKKEVESYPFVYDVIVAL